MKSLREAALMTGLILLCFLILGFITWPIVYLGVTEPPMNPRSVAEGIGAGVWLIFWFCFLISLISNASKKQRA